MFPKCMFRRLESVNSGAATAFSFTTVFGLVGVAARLTGGLPQPGFPPFAFAFQCRCFVAWSVLSDSSPTLQRVKLVVINCFICIVCLLTPLLSKGKWILVDVFVFFDLRIFNSRQNSLWLEKRRSLAWMGEGARLWEALYTHCK